MYCQDLSEKIISAAIEVHKHIGPGLLESVYELCLAKEFEIRGVQFERQKPLTLNYKDLKLDIHYRLDFLVENEIIVEIKCIEYLTPICTAQMLTYLKLTNKKVGLILNYKSALLKDGIRRVAL